MSTILPKQENGPPPAKRIKTEETTAPPPPPLNDPHHIWVGQSDEDIPKTFGAIVVQLTHAGLVNALTCDGNDNTNVDAADVKRTANVLHRALQAKMEGDFLETTPSRIHDMLCADVPLAEFKAIRKRVYDTVVLGKGMNHVADSEDLPVAARAVVHDADKVRCCTDLKCWSTLY